MNDVRARGPQPRANVAELRERIAELEVEVQILADSGLRWESGYNDLQETLDSANDALINLEERTLTAEAALERVRGLPEKWRFEVELCRTDSRIGLAVKHAVESRADELAAALEEE